LRNMSTENMFHRPLAKEMSNLLFFPRTEVGKQ